MTGDEFAITEYDMSGRELTRASCRCDDVDEAPPGIHRYCGAHDRATRYPGPVLRGESE
jgi:hypothetical protein